MKIIDNEQGLEEKSERNLRYKEMGRGRNAHVNEAKIESQTGTKLSCEFQELQGLGQACMKPREGSSFYSKPFSPLCVTRLSKMCECEVRCVHVCV